ncbi:hypothetical protein ASZ78_015183, partial [Callipepla squamata]
PFVSLKDAGTYQCRYQVSEPLWTSNRSDPVELVVEGVPPEAGKFQVSVPEPQNFPLGSTSPRKPQSYSIRTPNDPPRRTPTFTCPPTPTPYPAHEDPKSALWGTPTP